MTTPNDLPHFSSVLNPSQTDPMNDYNEAKKAVIAAHPAAIEKIYGHARKHIDRDLMSLASPPSGQWPYDDCETNNDELEQYQAARDDTWRRTEACLLGGVIRAMRELEDASKLPMPEHVRCKLRYEQTMLEYYFCGFTLAAAMEYSWLRIKDDMPGGWSLETAWRTSASFPDMYWYDPHADQRGMTPEIRVKKREVAQYEARRQATNLFIMFGFLTPLLWAEVRESIAGELKEGSAA